MIIRGTTTTVEFTIPLDTGQLAEAFITFTQNDRTVVEKPLQQCYCNGNIISAKLTQEESLMLEGNTSVAVALVAKTLSGDRVETIKYYERVEQTSKDGVI